MFRIRLFINSILIASLFVFTQCQNTGTKKNKQVSTNKGTNKESKTEKLIHYLEETGDYVNSRQFPSLIKASSVYEEINNNIHIIDIRHEDYFAKGHIKNAVNIPLPNIIEYFETEIVPFKYDKIVIVCYAGQYASYTSSILRLLGYGNVYALRWGMSGWNTKFAQDFWLKSVSAQYEGKLEITINKKAPTTHLPELETNKDTAEAIHRERIGNLLSKSIINKAFITADEAFSNPEKYYIINYDRKDKYLAGHIPGAIRYKPGATLGIISEMKTIPTDKEVIIYCGTGHNSAFATAYLQLIGYKAKTLIYGNNSFMYNKMLKEKTTLSWLPFTKEEIKDYPFVK